MDPNLVLTVPSRPSHVWWGGFALVIDGWMLGPAPIALTLLDAAHWLSVMKWSVQQFKSQGILHVGVSWNSR